MSRKVRTTRSNRNQPSAVGASRIEQLEGRWLLSTYTVTTPGDAAGAVTQTGAGTFNATTLRAAITAANAHAGADTIDFVGTGTISLFSALPAISNALTIAGPGASRLTVKRSSAASTNFSIFFLDSGVTATIAGLTIAKGTGTPVSFDPTFTDGGGILNEGNLTIAECTLTGNTTHGRANEGYGGGIENAGILTVVDSTLSGNSAPGSGSGALYNIYGSTATLTDCTISGNTAFEVGGGIGSNGRLILTNCTISGNKSGGGIIENGGAMSVTNCTISGNDALGFPGGDPGRGAIFNYIGAAAFVYDCTVAGNTGAGLYNYDGQGGQSGGNLTVTDSIVVGNLGPSKQPDDVVGNTTVSSSYNAIGTDQSGDLVNGVNGNKVGVSLSALKLGPLANNGGPTQTMALLPGSPAINAGDPNYDPSVAGLTDQRGFARLTDGNLGGTSRIDVGAYEAAGNIVVTSKLDDATGSNFTAANLTLRDAIVMANSSAGANTITFAPTVRGAITLNGNPLTPVSNQTIAGPGAASLTISAAGRSGIFRISSGNVTLSGLTLTGGNAGVGGGGAVYNRGGLTLAGDTLAANSAAQGGGLYNAATAVVIDCTIRGNAAGNGGGGIFNSSGPSTVNVFNSTLAGNKSSGVGGGIDNAGTLNLTNVTVSGNTAKSGGGLANTGAAKANNTILSANTGGDISGNLASTSAYNLIGSGGGLSNGKNGNLVGVANPLLGPLANNGGPTLTMALLAGSKAINTGSNALAFGPNGKTLPTDQRGRPRIVSGRVDMGAYEK